MYKATLNFMWIIELQELFIIIVKKIYVTSWIMWIVDFAKFWLR